MPFPFDAPFWAHAASVILVAAILAWLLWLVSRERRRRRKGDDARRRAEALLRLQAAAVTSAANSIIITDHVGRIEWCNSAFELMTGWSADEAIGRGARSLLQGREPADDTLRRMRRTLAFGKPWRGEMELRYRDGTAFTVDQTVTPILGDDGKIRHYVVVQEDVTERRRAEQRIHFLSSYDALTALPNRLLFRQRLERAVARALSEHSSLAVLFLDLDRFAQVNDFLGHDSGDRLLTAVVERLVGAAEGAETIARVGGDEFALLMGAGVDAGTAAALAQAVLESVTRPYELDGQTVSLGASVGITLFPGDGADAQTLMKNADIAMYRAMRELPNGYRFFSPGMDAELKARRRLEADLRSAVARGELELLYQPIVAARSRAIIAFEALVRWNRGGEELVLPDRFVPLAEETGLISQIGDWVLAEACRQTRVWNEEGLKAVPVAVNVSAVQMRGGDLPGRIRRALTETRLPAHLLEIELTESAVVEDPETAERLLAEIKALGVRMAVDDFGTGYSSLARLKRFPVDKLKLDKSFVADLVSNPGDAAIASAVIALAHGLGLQVVSEGVESEAQLRYLKDEGCDAVQGYLFSPPVEAGKAAELLRRGGFPE